MVKYSKYIADTQTNDRKPSSYLKSNVQTNVAIGKEPVIIPFLYSKFGYSVHSNLVAPKKRKDTSKYNFNVTANYGDIHPNRRRFPGYKDYLPKTYGGKVPSTLKGSTHIQTCANICNWYNSTYPFIKCVGFEYNPNNGSCFGYSEGSITKNCKNKNFFLGEKNLKEDLVSYITEEQVSNLKECKSYVRM